MDIAERLRQLRHRIPPLAFRVRLRNGTEFRVAGPERFALSEIGNDFVAFDQEQHVRHVGMEDVTAVEEIHPDPSEAADLAEKLRRLMRQRPFRPFTVHLRDGERFHVDKPDTFMVSPEGNSLATDDSEGRFRFVPMWRVKEAVADPT